MIVRGFLLGLLLFSSNILCAQIVNIESARLDPDSSRWSGQWNLSANYTKNTRQLLNITHNLAVVYQQDRSSWLFLNTADGAYANKSVLQNSLLGHLRYNYRQNKWLTYEALLQWQRNLPLNIQERWLMGGGPRFTFIPKPENSLHLATLLLYEEDDELERDLRHRSLRLSSYLSFQYKPRDDWSFNTVVYYQPRVDRWEDYRVALQAQLDIRLFKALSFNSTASISYDAFPAYSTEPIPRLTASWNNGIRYKF